MEQNFSSLEFAEAIAFLSAARINLLSMAERKFNPDWKIPTRALIDCILTAENIHITFCQKLLDDGFLGEKQREDEARVKPSHKRRKRTGTPKSVKFTDQAEEEVRKAIATGEIPVYSPLGTNKAIDESK